jgi:hypothetical protein
MGKATILQHDKGSAEEVIAHAEYLRSRGRTNPAMTFVGERNPGKALAIAEAIVQQATNYSMFNHVGVILAEKRRYDDMSDVQIEIAVRGIITDSSSEEEVTERLRAMGYEGEVMFHMHLPTDEISKEARELVRGLGGPIMKNGAMAQIMLEGHEDMIWV